MADHVTTVCRAGYYQLRQLRHITLSLSPTVAQTLVQAFISCRLDYCNSLFYGIADSQLRRLYTVCPECSCTTNHWYATYGAYHTSLADAPLATDQATDFVQGGSSGPQVPQRACTSLLG